jgi:hypothetical protein
VVLCKQHNRKADLKTLSQFIARRKNVFVKISRQDMCNAIETLDRSFAGFPVAASGNTTQTLPPPLL